MKVSGFGGYWVVQGAETNVIQHNAEYEYELEAITDDVQSVGSMGWIDGKPKACKFCSGSIDVPEDDEAYAEAIGFYIGTFFAAVWFRRGESEVYDAVINAQVADVKYKNRQKKCRVLEIKIEYGRFTYFVEPPNLEGLGPFPVGGSDEPF